MTDREAFNEFARGVALGIGIVAVLGLIIAIVGTEDISPEKKFQVVDRYKQCDVVRYTDDTQRWHYFLDCSVNRTSEGG